MTDEATTGAAVQQSLKRKPIHQRDVARWARRKKLLDKLRDADIEALLAFTDEVCEKMSEDSTYEKIEMLCLEVLELRKRLRRMGMDSNWEPANKSSPPPRKARKS